MLVIQLPKKEETAGNQFPSRRSVLFWFDVCNGIVKKPSYASYWANGNGNDLSYTPNFSQVMSRNRFQGILRFLHCNDNDLAVERGKAGFDPLHKVANIIEFVNRTLEENYRMIGFEGRHFLKQYIANKKAHRWGVKAWVLAESIQSSNGSNEAPLWNQHHVTITSWFTSPKLAHDLRNMGTYCTGTVITTRKGMPQSFIKARIPKGMTRKPYSKGNAPALVHKYKETMGGVDLGDQSKFKVMEEDFVQFTHDSSRHLKGNSIPKIYTKIFIQKKIDHLTFQQEIVQGLIGQHREGQTRPSRRRLHQSTRLTARHFIEWIPNKRRMRCAVYSGKENRFSETRIRTWCPDCGVGLCVGRCFKNFHILLMYEE
ncbi:unnamed protein product [Mytilus coruscus]|uniref:PiggyBac transposable element-derived protein domain-containing protein n=1 Tax=Mytilus coruscus TaxID=42192 RepID=A0A6J8F100_MYTCO|nr:unnamed protein product [Mytilus coruscus]